MAPLAAENESMRVNTVRFQTCFCVINVALAVVMLSEGDVLARGGSRGLHWGYHPPAGNPFTSMWRVASPWSAMNGGGIPHHYLGPANLNMNAGPRYYQNAAYANQRGSRSSGSFNTGRGMGNSQRGNSGRSSTGRTALRYSAPNYSVSARNSTGGPYFNDDDLQPKYYHSYDAYWYNGYWGGGERGWATWDEELGGMGFPRWSEPLLYFPSGYGSYQNPFVAPDSRRAPPFDYHKPISLMPETEPDVGGSSDSDSAPKATFAAVNKQVMKSPEMTAGLKAFDAAREVFRSGDLATALKNADEALQSLPHDPALHQFRGLVLFAQGDYRQAAAAIYAVLSVSPGWDWTTLSSMYANPDDYTEQLRKLETYRKQHPQEPEASFLLAYHYVTCRHLEAAVKHLRNVGKLLPDDQLVKHLETLVSDGIASSARLAAQDSSETAPESADDRIVSESVAPLEKATLVGAWHADARGGTRVELTLTEDGKFVWATSAGGNSRRIEGAFLVARDQLLLSSRSGTLIGVVTPQSTGGLNFRLLENPPEEKGLDFTR